MVKRLTVINVSKCNHEIEQRSFLFTNKVELESQKHPMEHLPLCEIPVKVLWMWVRWFLRPLSGLLSTKLIPVYCQTTPF